MRPEPPLPCLPVSTGNFPPQQQPVSFPPYQSNGFLQQQYNGLLPHQPGGAPPPVQNGNPTQPPRNFLPQPHGSFPPQQPESFSSQQPGNLPPQPPGNFQMQQPGNLPPQQPGSFPPQQPGNFQMQQPGNLPPQQPGSFPPQQPGNFPPQQPGSFPPQQPGNFPPQQPGSFPPQQPGNFPPQQPGNFPPQPPGSFPSQQPGSFQPQPPGIVQPQQPGNFPPQQPGYSPQNFSLGPPGVAGGQQGLPQQTQLGGIMPPQPGMMSPGMQQQQQRQRLDPDMMPSVVQVVEDDRSSRSGIFPTGFPTAELPPLVTTDFVAQDQGNCNPKFMRSTVYAIPQTQDFVKISQLPISLAITPVAELHPQEVPPPIIDLGELGPVRCQRCKAYMCPFMEFIDGGRKFKCPFCKASSTVEDSYFAHLDHTGRRTDIAYRPELYLGSYELIATKQYCKNGIKPKEPAFIFMLDVSYNAVRSGLVELFCRNAVELLKYLPKDYGMDRSTIKIGLATYDNVIHFYKLSNVGKPEMLIVNDINDVFAPLADGFLVDFDTAEASLISCLKEIVINFSETRITETVFGPVIQSGLDALKSVDRAGKLFIFHTSLPTLECPGQLKNREDRKVLGSDKEKTVLTPVNDFYIKLGEECVKYGCSVDLFLFPNSFIDVASVAPIVSLTGGSIYKYQYFECSNDGVRFLNDLKHDISRQIVFDVMMRVRTSTGIRPTSFYGSFYMQNTTDIEVSALDSNKSIQVEIKYDDKLDEKEAVFIQAAILFTSCSGQRRLLVHNLSLPVSADFNHIYRLTDEDTIITHLFKHAERTVRDKSPKEMREDIVLVCARILSTYREKCSESSPLGQLILPECLKLMPVHVNCITKNDALNGGSELTVDDRAWMMNLVPSMTVSDVLHFLYPRIYPLTQLSLDNDEVQMPIQVRASIEYFQQDEAYLIENGMVAFVWIGLNAPQQWLQNVFNVNSIQNLDSEKHDIPERDNDSSKALHQLLATMNGGRQRYLKIFIIKQQDGLESWMKKFLVEDRYAANSTSYIEFLCQVHREIRNLLT